MQAAGLLHALRVEGVRALPEAGCAAGSCAEGEEGHGGVGGGRVWHGRGGGGPGGRAMTPPSFWVGPFLAPSG